MYLFLGISFNASLLFQPWVLVTAQRIQCPMVAVVEGAGGLFVLALPGKWWAHLDSNQGPTGYEPVALAN
jgi:hypothetical protein